MRIHIKTIATVEEMHKLSSRFRKEGKLIGLVPTMGFLHEGHLSLVDKSKSICDITVVTIFVNPTQFAPNEDLKSYPRDFERDKKLLSEKGVDVIFYPAVEEIYPDNFQTNVEVTNISKLLEGESRPSHFKGVTTIVSILFNSVSPHYAFFGQKDAQQVSVIQQMVNDLKFDLKIVVCPIVREKDGLAMSSRNVYLSKQERVDALVLSKSLKIAEDIIKQGIRDKERIISKMKDLIQQVKSSNLDYIQIVDAITFNLIDELVDGKEYYILIACKIGSTRLIDNLKIKI